MHRPDPDDTARDELQRDVAARKQRVERDLHELSSLPREVFEACDPMVETALAEAALRVIRRHLRSEEASVYDVEPPEDDLLEPIDPLLQRRTAEELALACDGPPPSPDERLAEERMWILLDLSKHGSGVARQKASQELRDLLADPDVADQIGRAVLDRLVPLLAETKARKGMPVIFHALHKCAERALGQDKEAR